MDIDTDADTLNSAVALRGLFYPHPRNLQLPHVRRFSRCSTMGMENDLHCGLEVGAGRVSVTYGLRFGFVPGFTPTPIPMSTPLPLAAPAPGPCQCQPHEKHVHMHKESRSYAEANMAASAAFYSYPDANVFLRLLQFMPLQLRHQL